MSMAKFQVQLSGEWRDFSEELHVQLASAWDASCLLVYLQQGGQDYEISLAKMEQRNLVTGKTRRIRPPHHPTRSSSELTCSALRDAARSSGTSVSAIRYASCVLADGCEPSWTGLGGEFCESQSRELAFSPERVVEAFECPCCMDDVPPMNGLRTCPMPKPLGCEHSICKECFKRLVAGQIEKKEPCVCPMCPDTRAAMIPSWLVWKILGQESAKAMADIEQLHLGQANGGKIRLWQCPTPDCKNQMVLPQWWDHSKITDRRRLQHCLGCKKTICLRCDVEEHTGVSCDAYREWKKANAASDQSYAELINSGLIKPCPNCGSPILKNDGCNFMTCSSCKSPNGMCWATGKPRYGPGGCGGGHNCH